MSAHVLMLESLTIDQPTMNCNNKQFKLKMEIIEQQCLSLNWLMFQESEGLGPLSKKKDKN